MMEFRGINQDPKQDSGFSSTKQDNYVFDVID